VVTTSLEDVAKTHQVALNVSSWIFQRIANTGLGCKIHHNARLLCRKQLEQGITILQSQALESPSSRLWRGLCLDASKACLLQGWVVIVIEIVNADYTIAPLEQSLAQRRSNESGSARNQNRT
jgi:hypothetical protein